MYGSVFLSVRLLGTTPRADGKGIVFLSISARQYLLLRMTKATSAFKCSCPSAILVWMNKAIYLSVGTHVCWLFVVGVRDKTEYNVVVSFSRHFGNAPTRICVKHDYGHPLFVVTPVRHKL